MNINKLPLCISILVSLLFLQGCGDVDKKLDGQIIKTADGRFFTIHHNVGDNYFLRRVDIDNAKATVEFIEKEVKKTGE